MWLVTQMNLEYAFPWFAHYYRQPVSRQQKERLCWVICIWETCIRSCCSSREWMKSPKSSRYIIIRHQWLCLRFLYFLQNLASVCCQFLFIAIFFRLCETNTASSGFVKISIKCKISWMARFGGVLLFLAITVWLLMHLHCDSRGWRALYILLAWNFCQNSFICNLYSSGIWYIFLLCKVGIYLP